MSHLVDLLGDAVVVVDTGSRVVRANAAVDPVLGWPPGRLLGQALVDVMDPAAWAAAVGRTPTRLVVRRPDRSRVDVEAVVTAGPGGTTVGVLRRPAPRPAAEPTESVSARLTEQKRAERQLFESGERFASLAYTLQQSLLPPDLPDVPGVELAARYHPAGAGLEVGGDFYDVFRIGRGTWGVVIGDVCGKGAEAAALTALARYTVRAAAMQTAAPGRVLSMLNDAMVRQAAGAAQHPSADGVGLETVDERFATVVFVVVRRARGRITLSVACGGHSPPLVVRADGSVVPVGRPGTLLGLFRSVELEAEEVELAPGDALVLYTDGVTEAPGPGGQFGDERLAALLSSLAGAGAGEIAGVVEAAVSAHQGGPSRDDLAVLVLKVPDPS